MGPKRPTRPRIQQKRPTNTSTLEEARKKTWNTSNSKNTTTQKGWKREKGLKSSEVINVYRGRECGEGAFGSH